MIITKEIAESLIGCEIKDITVEHEKVGEDDKWVLLDPKPKKKTYTIVAGAADE